MMHFLQMLFFRCGLFIYFFFFLPLLRIGLHNRGKGSRENEISVYYRNENQTTQCVERAALLLYYLCIFLSFYQPVSLFINLPNPNPITMNLPIRRYFHKFSPFICLPINMPMHQSIYINLSIHPSIHESAHPLLYPQICLSITISINLPTHPYFHKSTYPSLFP